MRKRDEEEQTRWRDFFRSNRLRINSERVSVDLMWRAHVQMSACSANVTASLFKHLDKEYIQKRTNVWKLLLSKWFLKACYWSLKQKNFFGKILGKVENLKQNDLSWNDCQPLQLQQWASKSFYHCTSSSKSDEHQEYLSTVSEPKCCRKSFERYKVVYIETYQYLNCFDYQRQHSKIVSQAKYENSETSPILKSSQISRWVR